MVRLPASLERRLQQLFPRVREREQFVAEVVTQALDDQPQSAMEESAPLTVGGTLHLFSDGGSRGNPGQAAIGCVLEDPARGVTLQEISEAIGIETNNVAEYRALIEGLKMASQYHPNRLICHLDSELIVRQLSGEYRVKMETLKEFFEEIQEIKLQFPSIEFRYVPREDNHRADALVNRALDALKPRASLPPRPMR